MINLADELDDEFLEDLEETNKNFRLIQQEHPNEEGPPELEEEEIKGVPKLESGSEEQEGSDDELTEEREVKETDDKKVRFEGVAPLDDPVFKKTPAELGEHIRQNMRGIEP